MLKTLRKLRKEMPRRFRELRDKCDLLAGRFSSALVALISALTFFVGGIVELQKNGLESVNDEADKYFDLLQLSCETKQPRVIEISLEAIRFMIGGFRMSRLFQPAHDHIENAYLRGSKRIVVAVPKPNLSDDSDTRPSERRTLMDLVIETIAKCAEEYDDVVHSAVNFLLPLFHYLIMLCLVRFLVFCCRQ